MEYWRGVMNWPVIRDWKCEICGEQHMIWGLPHALCRCNTCHTQYRMRDKEGNKVITPICQLKPEYCGPAKMGYKRYAAPIDEFTDKQWNILFIA